MPTRTTVAVQREDIGPWTHGTIAHYGDDEHSGWLYKIGIIRMGRMVIMTAGHVKQTQQNCNSETKWYKNQFQYREDIYR